MKPNRKRLRKLLSQPMLNANDLSRELHNGGLLVPFFVTKRKDGKYFLIHWGKEGTTCAQEYFFDAPENAGRPVFICPDITDETNPAVITTNFDL